MAIIRMKEMEFYGYTGCLPEEKVNGQTFVITCEMNCDSIPGCETDELEGTVNYAEVYEVIKDEVESSHCNLIEYLANNLAKKVLAISDLITEVKIIVSKPQAPIDGKFKTMEVEVTLHA